MPRIKQDGEARRKPGRPPKQVQPVSQPQAGEQVAPSLASTPAERKALHGWARNDPDMLAGEALIQLANERGMALSELRRMDDTKIREQLRYITAHHYGA